MYIQRNIVLLMTLFMGMLSVIAQNTNSVSGRVIDKQSKEAMEKSTLQLYQVTTARNGVKDTTFISGTFSNDLGYFTFNSVKKGNYLLKVSYLGYQELYQSHHRAHEAVRCHAPGSGKILYVSSADEGSCPLYR